MRYRSTSKSSVYHLTSHRWRSEHSIIADFTNIFLDIHLANLTPRQPLDEIDTDFEQRIRSAAAQRILPYY